MFTNSHVKDLTVTHHLDNPAIANLHQNLCPGNFLWICVINDLNLVRHYLSTHWHTLHQCTVKVIRRFYLISKTAEQALSFCRTWCISNDKWNKSHTYFRQRAENQRHISVSTVVRSLIFLFTIEIKVRSYFWKLMCSWEDQVLQAIQHWS